LPSPTGGIYFAIDLQHHPSSRARFSGWRALLAGWLCVWVVFCGTVALNESWHDRLHQVVGDAPAAEAGCAIDLFAIGGVTPFQAPPAWVTAFLGSPRVTVHRTVHSISLRQVARASLTRGPPRPS
jgi:hypothetical protein